MAEIQNVEAQKILSFLKPVVLAGERLNYQSVAQKLGRDPKKNARMVAQVCDMLDAAAVLADVPLMALISVLDASNSINSEAWSGPTVPQGFREAVIKRSRSHTPHYW